MLMMVVMCVNVCVACSNMRELRLVWLGCDVGKTLSGVCVCTRVHAYVHVGKC